MFGGYSYEMGEEYYMGTGLNDLWEYDLDNHQWTEIIIDGNKPKPLQDHAMAYSPDTNEIVVFGGLQSNEPPITFTDETWILNLDKMKWKQVIYEEDDNVPMFQIDTQLAYLGEDAFMMFSAYTYNGMIPTTWIFNVKFKKWYKCQIIGDEKPEPRDCYGLTSIDNKAYMFGGLGSEGKYFNDLWEFQITGVEQMSD
jgi:hypothetical protein